MDNITLIEKSLTDFGKNFRKFTFGTHVQFHVYSTNFTSHQLSELHNLSGGCNFEIHNNFLVVTLV